MPAATKKRLDKAINYPRCQCTESCRRRSLPGSAFCEIHAKGCQRKSPLTGYEPPSEFDKYNKDIIKTIGTNFTKFLN